MAILLSCAAAGAADSVRSTTGREAVASVRHDWKKDAQATVHTRSQSLLPVPANHTRSQSLLPVPANYAHLSPEARLAFLHARRNLDPTRFDHYHPWIGSKLANDDRMKMAESQTCMPTNGILPNTSLTRYLEYRRSLDPTRFDFYHPTLGAILYENDQLKMMAANCIGGELIPPPVPPTSPPGTPGPGPPTGGGPPPPRMVPEPGALALVIVGSVGACVPCLARRWRARSAARS